MAMDYRRGKEIIFSNDAGDPGKGLSDAIVGTYGPVRSPDSDDGDMNFPPEVCLPPSTRVLPDPRILPSFCCVGIGTGFLIEESEIVL